MDRDNQAPSQEERFQGYWPILWRERKLSVVLNGLAAALFIPSFLVSWAFMKDGDDNELYALASSSLIVTIIAVGAFVLPLAVLYWLNCTREVARISKMLLSACVFTLGLVGAVEILIALTLALERWDRNWANEVTSIAFNPHGFMLLRLCLTVSLVLSMGVVWGIHRWMNPVGGQAS
jgi:glucan phosphoethanolaminetransferase (alkaline phosphatase superfamily)